MNGAVATSQVYLGAVADLGFQVAGLADHDRDGRADVLWHHATSGDVWVWHDERRTPSRGSTHVATVGDTNFHVAGVGDYDGDGRADVLWHHATTGAVWVWLMNGAEHHVGDAGGHGAGRGVSDRQSRSERAAGWARPDARRLRVRGHSRRGVYASTEGVHAKHQVLVSRYSDGIGSSRRWGPRRPAENPRVESQEAGSTPVR